METIPGSIVFFTPFFLHTLPFTHLVLIMVMDIDYLISILFPGTNNLARFLGAILWTGPFLMPSSFDSPFVVK
jgi:hypothetical protein